MRTPLTSLAIWIALLILLAGTIGASFILSGLVGLAVSLGIATAKSALIYWRFMHLNEAPALSRIAALAAVGWILILFLFLCVDVLSRSA